MIKKYIIAGITACLGFIGFSNASAIFGQAIVGNTAQSVVNNSLDVMVGRYVEFTTSLLGTNKRVFATFPESMFYRDLNGRLSVSFNAGGNRPILNGNLKYFRVCDKIIGDFVGFQNMNCTRYTYSENINTINNMLSYVNIGDLVIYGDAAINRGSSAIQPFIAISIENLEKTVLFNWGVCLYSDNRCALDYGFSRYDISFGGDYLLENTTNNGYNFSTIPNNIIGVSPVYQTPEEETPSGTSSNNYFCPTIGQLMKNMGANYNTGLCYNGGLKYENGQITTVEKKDIFTVFTDYTEYVNRIGIYRNNCNSTSTQANCQSAFNGNREKYSIIANAINSNVDEKKLWNYCNMGLNYDPNTTTCVASGYITEKPTIEEITNEIINGDYTTILTPGTGTIFDNMNAGEGTGTTYEDVATRDVFGNITQIYDKITRIFEGRSGVNGIIPDYILWMIFVILFFTVLMKK